MTILLYICSFCLILAGHETFPQRVCAPQDVLDYLNLNINNEKFVTSRPVRDWTHPTKVYLDIYLSAILSVVEKSQIFVSCLWISMTWHNELISWDPEDFCGITKVSLPKEMLWKPDISIYELAEKESGPPSSYIYITHHGDVNMESVLRVVTTCTMDVHKFPFDTQSCHMTICSMLHSNNEIKLFASSNSSKITQLSRKILMTQGEWELLSMTVMEDNISFVEGGTWDLIKYTITMKRKPLLYILNFQLPVLFFLILDLASYFIPDTKGDKISFKVTILLAISVLLLILNETLPSKSVKCPLIATYIIFIFAFMMVSLLETILVTHLTEMDSSATEEQDFSNSLNPDQLFTTQNGTMTSGRDKRRRGSDGHTSSGVNSPESLAGMGLVGAGATADVHLLQLIIQELQALQKNVQALAPRAQCRDRYWSKVAKRINAAFLVFYFGASFLFLIFISLEWMD